jgi:cyclopropane fatty-acyl-phospholipid synthase-like methyltransferase
VNLLRGKGDPIGIEKCDLIYSAGFLGYLTDRTTERLIGYLYGLLKVGGTLILVNIFKDHPSKIYLELIGEWFLNHRDENEMMSFGDALEGAKKEIWFDPTRTNIYLIIKKIR